MTAQEWAEKTSRTERAFLWRVAHEQHRLIYSSSDNDYYLLVDADDRATLAIDSQGKLYSIDVIIKEVVAQ